MSTKWTVALCCSLAILGMFLPFYNDKTLASFPMHFSFTGGAMFGAPGEAAANEMVVVKAIADLVWAIPVSASLLVFAAAAGPLARLPQILVGVLWIVVVVVIPTVAVDIGLTAMKPFFPGLPSPLAWIGLGVGGWLVVLAGIVLIASASSRASRPSIGQSVDDRAPNDESLSRDARS